VIIADRRGESGRRVHRRSAMVRRRQLQSAALSRTPSRNGAGPVVRHAHRGAMERDARRPARACFRAAAEAARR
jgi:hypothetical protein